MNRSEQKERFTVRAIESRAKTVFEVYGRRVSGERVRKRFDKEQEAESFKDLRLAEYARDLSYRPRLTRLSDDQIAAAEKAFSVLEEKPGASLVEAARFYVRAHVPETREKITLRAAAQEFLGDGSLERHMRYNSIREVFYNVEQLRRSCPARIHVHELTPELVEAWLADKKPETARVKKNKLSSFLNWALKQGYTGRNIVTGLTRPKERKIRVEKDPEILTLDQVNNLMKAATEVQEGALLPYYALHLFGGLRAEEVKKLDWDAISVKAGLITLRAGVAKTGTRRHVEMPENLKAFLRDPARVRQAIIPANFQKLTMKVRAAAEISEWARDMGRHTAVSYYYAACSDKVKTAAWAGHSVQVLDRHYRGLVTPEQAAAYWSITPATLRKTKIVTFAGEHKEAVNG